MSDPNQAAPTASDLKRGAIAWMARNPVAANLLMFVLLVGGAIMGSRVKQEVFPEFELDFVNISVPYPGASPSDVERGIVQPVEEAVRGLDGVKRVTGYALEGVGSVTLEVLSGADPDKVATDVKNAVDRITLFPRDAEKPVVSLATMRRQVISMVVYGDVPERVLRDIGEQVREDLLDKPEITQVDITGVRPVEIAVEVAQATLRTYGLTLPTIAERIAAVSVELPAGGVKTTSGEVLVRAAERRERGAEFADIPILSDAAGPKLRLGEIATITDGFQDTDQSAYFDGKRALMINVYRVGDETPTSIATTVKEYIAGAELPPGVGLAIWNDTSEILEDRIDLLLRNAHTGLILVLICLGLLLEVRLAFWVTLGIPISFFGALLLMPMFGASINMISLFAFIVTLGMVVDDAIVVGENIFEMRQRGVPRMRAAIEGARQVGTPVVFSILTTVAAFSPLFFVPGIMGKFFFVTPVIVITVLAISLVESLFVLPSHLAHKGSVGGLLGFVFGGIGLVLGPLLWVADRARNLSSGALDWLIQKTYRPVLLAALRWRYFTFALSIAVLVGTCGFVAGGHVGFTFMPKIESDLVTASLELPFGSPVSETEAVQERMVEAAREVIAESGGDDIVRGLYSTVGSSPAGQGPGAVAGTNGGHLAGVQVFLVSIDKRDVTAAEFAKRWREKVGELPGIESLTFTFSTGPSGGSPIDVELSHRDIPTLERAAADMAQRLTDFAGVIDIDDGVKLGKPQLDFNVTPAGHSLGLTPANVSRQVRAAFFGAEASRQQRGRDELRVMVRLPQDERASEHDIEQLMLRTPAGGEVPFRVAAEIERGRAYTRIKRTDGRRVLNVTADVIPGVANANQVLAAVQKDHLPALVQEYPGLTWSLEGEQRSQKESFDALKSSYLMALLVIFALLAIPFKSYIQPIVVMIAIPFGIIGAIVGHKLLGYELSLMSMMGIIALSGVVVNGSLVLVDSANRMRREEGKTDFDAVSEAGVRRFRPILLTSLTTFLGLMPMIFETSLQARFLIPMAISLGFGVLFSTFIILLLVPSLYVIIEDLRALLGFQRNPAAEDDHDDDEQPPAAARDADPASDDGHRLTPIPAAARHSDEAEAVA